MMHLPPVRLAANTVIQSVICSAPITPVITLPVDGSSFTGVSMSVDGTAASSVTVSVLDNNQLAGQATADSGGSFGVSIPLTAGTNSIVAQSTNDCGTVSSSIVTVTVTFPSTTTTEPATNPTQAATTAAPVAGAETSPELAITSKTESVTVTGSSYLLTGTADPFAVIIVSVNGVQVAQITAASDGAFSVLIPLSTKDNTIKVVSRFKGKETETSFVIHQLVSDANVGGLKISYIYWIIGGFILAATGFNFIGGRKEKR